MTTYLSPHFTLSEFIISSIAERKGIDNTPSPGILENLKMLAVWLEGVRTILGRPIIISSGYRCPQLNRAVGGSPTSDHQQGYAVDFICPGFGSTRQVIDTLVQSGIEYDQLILEYPKSPSGGWVHGSWRPTNRRHHALITNGGGVYSPLYA